MKKKLVIVGSGPAGLVCAFSACKNGIDASDILIIEREEELGGILKQCIHTGYLKTLTGTEFASRLIQKIKEKEIGYILNSSVISFDKDRVLTVVSPELGYTKIEADAIVLATGCREKSKGGLLIGGTRPAGVMSAGTAQRFVNIFGLMPGKRTVVVGTTELALIIARRLTLEGGHVLCVCDNKKSTIADKKYVKECIRDFNIPLKLSHSIRRIYGKERIEAVEICEVDKKGRVIKGTKQKLECDSLVYSCGYIPDSDLVREAGIPIKKATKGPVTKKNLETDIEGVFVVGNALFIHACVDDIVKEGQEVGESVYKYISKKEIQRKKAQEAEKK